MQGLRSAGLDRHLINRKKRERILHPNGPDQGDGSFPFPSDFQNFPSGPNSRSTTAPDTLLRDRSWQDSDRPVDQRLLVPRLVDLLLMQRTSILHPCCPVEKLVDVGFVPSDLEFCVNGVFYDRSPSLGLSLRVTGVLPAIILRRC